MLETTCITALRLVCDYWDNKFKTQTRTFSLLKDYPDFNEIEKSGGMFIYYAVRDKLPVDASVFQVVSTFKEIDENIGVRIIKNLNLLKSGKYTIMQMVSKAFFLTPDEEKNIERWVKLLEENLGIGG